MHSTSNFFLWLKFPLEVTLVRPWYAMKQFIANCCLFLQFLNWNVLWKWSKFSDNFCSPTNKSNLFTRMKGFLYYPSKASTKLFLPFLTENHGGKSTYCLLSKQSHINSLSLWKGFAMLATVLKSNPGGAVTLLVHFIINPTSKSQSGNHLSYIFDIFEKNLPDRYTKSCALQQTIDRLYPNFFQGLTKFPSLKRGWNIVLTGIFSWQMIAEGLSSYPP